MKSEEAIVSTKYCLSNYSEKSMKDEREKSKFPTRKAEDDKDKGAS